MYVKYNVWYVDYYLIIRSIRPLTQKEQMKSFFET